MLHSLPKDVLHEIQQENHSATPDCIEGALLYELTLLHLALDHMIVL